MAARKTKKTPGTAVANIQEQIAKQAARADESTGSIVGNRLRVTQDKQFLAPDGNKNRGPLNVVIVDYCSMNAWFEGAFDNDNPKPPDCFALSQPASIGGPESSPNNLIASMNSPQRMADACKGCGLNEFGSDRKGGAGKDCKNTRVLAVAAADAEDPVNTPLLLLSVSPGAIKGFDAYVKVLGNSGRIPVSVVTEISFNPDFDYASLCFKAVEPNAQLGAHFARQAEAQQLLSQEPDYSQVNTEKKAPVKRTTKKKAGSRRRTA